MWSFRRPGGNGMELAYSDAAAILFFLYKEKEKNGGAKNKLFTVSYRERQTRPPHRVVPLVCRFFNFYLQKRSF